MVGILDFLSQPDQSAYGGLLNLPAGQGFPAVPKEADPKELWDQITAETARQNAEADRRNAAGLARSPIAPTYPFTAPDQNNPAVQSALGNIQPAVAPVNTVPLSQAEQKMMALVGGGQPVPQPNAPFGALAPLAAPPAPIGAGASQAQVPLPQSRPASAPVTVPPADETALPSNAQPAIGKAVQPSASEPAQPGVMAGLNNFIDTHRNQLMGLAAGLAGAPSLGTGISRGLTGASAGSQLDIKQAMQQGAIGPTYRALVSAGVPPQQALAAVYNPTILKSVTENYLGDRKGEIHMVKDEFGADHPMIFDPYSKTLKPVSPPAGGDGGGETSSATSPAGSSSFLAPGVTSVDQSKGGEDYLNQYSPTVQAAVHDYIEGKSMPTGNPRGGYATQIKAIAGKYGQDVGTPADDTMFTQRRTMRADLGKDTVSSLGGQITTGEHASDILARMGKASEDLGNVDVGLAGPSHVINDIRGMTSTQAAKMQALQSEAQHYGQEITKFYSGSPGGEGERNRFMTSIGAAKTPQELASVLEHESELLHDRMTSIEGHIKGTLGEKGLAENPVIRPAAQKSFDAVSQSVARLRGGNAPMAAPAGAPAAVSSQAQYDVLPSGSAYLAPDGSTRTKK